MNHHEIAKQVEEPTLQTEVVHRSLEPNKIMILNTTTKQSVALPLRLTTISPESRADAIYTIVSDFLNEQFVSQKLLPCTFYEILSLTKDVHTVSIYETKNDAIHEMPPSYQFIFTNITQKELLEELGSVITDHFVHVIKERGDAS